MKAVKRLAIAVAVAGLSLGAPALAQDAAPTNSAAPADSIGPRELQNFSLSGTVTKPAEQPAATAPARRAPPKSTAAADQPTAAPESPAAPRRADPPARETTITRTEPLAAAPSAASIGPRRQEQVPQVSSLTVKLPPASSSGASAATPGFAEEPATAPPLSPERRVPLWPWLLAAVALGAGGAFLFWRNRHQREAFAGGPQADSFVAPDPAPRRAAALAPSPQPSAKPPAGIVATRLRPWLDIGFTPLRCVVEQEQVVFEFEVTLANSGTASARDVLIEARMINASPTQEQDIAKFFANPVGEGDRIASIAPLKRVELRPRLAVPLGEVRVLGAGGRKVFVPLIVFNALYNWGRDEGQTSAAFLVGRDTKGEKMAPFRLDLGPRLFRAVAGLELPGAVRR